MPERLRVLLIAFYYPPTSGGGVERTLQFSRRLPALGVDVELLVPTDAKWLAEDPASVSRIPNDVVVHRVKSRGPSLRQLPGDRIRQAPTTARKLAVRASLAPQRLFLPDANAPWLADVVPAALKLLKTGRFDAFITTTPPHTVAVAGRLIRARTDVPWIADWRDPWLTHADLDLSRADVRAKQAAIARLARWCVGGMDAASVVDHAEDEVRTLRPDLPLAVIPNGIDLEELATIERHPDPDHCTFAFTGWFFGDRSPRYLLQAVADLVRDRPELRDVVRLRFMGGFPDADRRRVTDLGIDELVAIEPPAPHADALQAQADADVALIFMQDGGGHGGKFLPGKVWELLACGRPVLAMLPPDGAAAHELQAVDAAIVAPDDVAGARAAVERYVDAWSAGQLPSPVLADDIRARISRHTQAEDLARLIRTTVDFAKGPGPFA
jgi:glycosyltransferase involved in cell wall biosynthesis